MLGQSFTVDLPHGLFDEDGACHRAAVLRQLTGHEELLLGEADAGARAVSDLLAAVIERVGEYEPVDAALAASLTRGDRQHLVLQLRAALYGDRIPLIVRCQNPVCRALSDLDVRISELAPPGEPRATPWIDCATASGAAAVREPTGADDAAIAEAGGTRAQRSSRLWSRLVLLDEHEVTPEAWDALPAATRHAIAIALADGSRGPDLVFLARCPTCAAGLEIVLEPHALLARELQVGSDRLLAEVHAIAFHYHWSETEILALPRSRRWRYLQLIGRELEGRPLTDAWS